MAPKSIRKATLSDKTEKTAPDPIQEEERTSNRYVGSIQFSGGDLECLMDISYKLDSLVFTAESMIDDTTAIALHAFARYIQAELNEELSRLERVFFDQEKGGVQ